MASISGERTRVYLLDAVSIYTTFDFKLMITFGVGMGQLPYEMDITQADSKSHSGMEWSYVLP